MTMGTDKKKFTGKKKPQQGQRKRASSPPGEDPPKRQKKADEKTTAKSAPDQSKKGPHESPLPRLDPKSVGYFRRVGETLQQDFASEEDRALFVRNVFNEVKGNELALAGDMSGSIVLQKLMTVAASAQLCQVLEVLSKNWQTVCWHRSAAHVVQTALLQYERLQKATDDGAEEEEDDDGDEPCGSLEDLILSLCMEVKAKFLPYNQNTHGSFIVRTLFQVLSGTILNQEASKKGGQGLTVSSEFEVPPSFMQQLEDLSGLFKSHIGVFATHKLASLGMQSALQVLHRKSPSMCKTLCDEVISYLSSRNVSGDGSALLVFLKDETSSRLLEKILEVSKKKQLRRLFEDHFKGQLHALSVHPIANYTVQRLLRAVQTKKLFSTLFEELSPAVEDVLAKGNMGIITTLAETCKRLESHQTQLVSHLMEAFHCTSPSSRRVACVPLLLSLLTYETYYKMEEEENPSEHKDNPDIKLQSVNYHGSVLLQHLLHFEDPAPVLHSLGSMSEADLHTVACSQAGSHIFDALLNSATITEKQRKKVLRKLRAHCMELACNKYGSRVLDRVWNASTMGVKEEIAQKLVERLRELQNDPIGHHIARNFALTHFANRRKDWEEHQQAENKRRKMFADILED
ncbi:nucleolar protein 9 [Hyla sarda]|uniref:nucleolar protein 9 n=1 Tax=Hyla sarda TaxID=327740 RepID=UPI0024C38D92|nr:nucleolar protein 9 [Hyla sarda]XP_056402017.1 nucleolar protein 9 [Hyla sarda]